MLTPSDGAAVDTTTATIEVFILTMILNQDIQQKAQAELDRVIGSERLPSLSECVSSQNRLC